MDRPSQQITSGRLIVSQLIVLANTLAANRSRHIGFLNYTLVCEGIAWKQSWTIFEALKGKAVSSAGQAMIVHLRI